MSSTVASFVGGGSAAPSEPSEIAGPLVPPSAGYQRRTRELLDPSRVEEVRRSNLQGQLKSNFWYEVSRLALWATTGLIALTVGAYFAAAGTTLAALGPVVPLIGAAVAGTVLVASSQYSKKTFANRWFDVQDFQMQRQAALVGQSVQHAVTPVLQEAATRPTSRPILEASSEVQASTIEAEQRLAALTAARA